MLHVHGSIRDPAQFLKRMAEMLEFPVAAPPAPGEADLIAPGVLWLRMPLPFALNHINLWLLEDGPGWTIVDCGFAGAETTGLWEQLFAAYLGGRSVRRIIVTHYHPDHIGLAGWLAERWQAPLWITEKEAARAHDDRRRRRRLCTGGARFCPAGRPRRGGERRLCGAPCRLQARRALGAADLSPDR